MLDYTFPHLRVSILIIPSYRSSVERSELNPFCGEIPFNTLRMSKLTPMTP